MRGPLPAGRVGHNANDVMLVKPNAAVNLLYHSGDILRVQRPADGKVDTQSAGPPSKAQ